MPRAIDRGIYKGVDEAVGAWMGALRSLLEQLGTARPDLKKTMLHAIPGPTPLAAAVNQALARYDVGVPVVGLGVVGSGVPTLDGLHLDPRYLTEIAHEL